MPQTIPVVVCPECAGLEPGAYVGESSGDVVTYPQEHFADHRGFLHCHRCGVVWNVLYEFPGGSDVGQVPASLSFDERGNLGGSSFKVDDAPKGQAAYFRRLFRTHALNAFGFGNRRVERTAERIYDAEALCTILDLPSDVKAAVVYHVRILSTRADFRTLAASVSGTVRSEALVVATVSLVMERFGIERDRGLGKMLQAFRFTKGTPTITLQEYAAAYLAVARWFGQRVWRDGPEDAPLSNQQEN